MTYTYNRTILNTYFHLKEEVNCEFSKHVVDKQKSYQVKCNLRMIRSVLSLISKVDLYVFYRRKMLENEIRNLRDMKEVGT